jgi:hypothetical protein
VIANFCGKNLLNVFVQLANKKGFKQKKDICCQAATAK